MGKLNSLIKFLVININGFLALGGLGIIVVASIVLSSDFVQLNEDYIKKRVIFMICSGMLIVVMTIIGCMGTVRQTQRDVRLGGRRLLSIYQLILLAVASGQGVVSVGLYRIEVNLTEAADWLPDDYGEFEGRFRDGFNEAYFEQQQCTDQEGDESWIWSLVESHCSGMVSKRSCQCSRMSEQFFSECALADTYSVEVCCPDQDLCEGGQDLSCPYSGCRKEVLYVILDYITPARTYSTVVFVLEATTVILTCLLICYNPRDTTEDMLVKTGTFVRRSGGQLGFAGQSSSMPWASGPYGASKSSADTGESSRLLLAKPGEGATMSSLPSDPLQQFMSPKNAASKRNCHVRVRSRGQALELALTPPDTPYGFDGNESRPKSTNTREAEAARGSSSAGFSVATRATRQNQAASAAAAAAASPSPSVLGASVDSRGRSMGREQPSIDGRQAVKPRGLAMLHEGEENAGVKTEEDRDDAKYSATATTARRESVAKDAGVPSSDTTTAGFRQATGENDSEDTDEPQPDEPSERTHSNGEGEPPEQASPLIPAQSPVGTGSRSASSPESSASPSPDSERSPELGAMEASDNEYFATSTELPIEISTGVAPDLPAEIPTEIPNVVPIDLPADLPTAAWVATTSGSEETVDGSEEEQKRRDASSPENELPPVSPLQEALLEEYEERYSEPTDRSANRDVAEHESPVAPALPSSKDSSSSTLSGGED